MVAIASYLRPPKASYLTSTGAKIGHLDLILDASGHVTPHAFLKNPGRRFAGINIIAYPEVVTFHWPDMTAPDYVPLSFWRSLLNRLPHRTCVSCIGSHGRTGTALAALLIADNFAATEPDPVTRAKVIIAHVRKVHCHKCIETPSQEKYILDLVHQSQAR